jgi:hypothetical protein
VEDPAEETFAARILHIITTFGAGLQTGPGSSKSLIIRLVALV